MADSTVSTYNDTLEQALLVRKDWLEESEMAKLKEELRIYQISYSVLYNMFLKKKLIHEDPYKQETKISDLQVPETGAINEAKRLEQISIRLASYDSQLDFLVNFYQFGVDFLNLERIRKIVGLVRYIDWMSLTPDSKQPNTRIFADIISQAKSGADPLTMSIIGESLTKLPKCTTTIMVILRDLTTYHKEAYKLNVRGIITGMQPADLNPAAIKKKLATTKPVTPFYQEFINELLKEDYSKEGPNLKEKILKSLKLAEEKPKAVKPQVQYKDVLLSGLQAVSTAAPVMTDVARKMDENQEILENRKKGFWEKLMKLLRSMTKSGPEEVVYELQFIDQAKGTETHELLNFRQFRAEFDRKIKIFTGMGGQGPVVAKLKAMTEDQILGYLERAIKDLQAIHRTLTALDEYFKSSVSREERDQIKGIKPELASIKNCFIKANQIRHEYSAQKEEEEQMKRLGINPNV